jgi:hypothetical protein
MWFGNALCWYRPEGAILVLPVVSAVSDEEADLGRNSAVATMVARLKGAFRNSIPVFLFTSGCPSANYLKGREVY